RLRRLCGIAGREERGLSDQVQDKGEIGRRHQKQRSREPRDGAGATSGNALQRGFAPRLAKEPGTFLPCGIRRPGVLPEGALLQIVPGGLDARERFIVLRQPRAPAIGGVAGLPAGLSAKTCFWAAPSPMSNASTTPARSRALREIPIVSSVNASPGVAL